MRPVFHIYENIISLENLLASWQEFLRGKRKRKDVIEFSLHFLENIFELQKELSEQTYRHGGYHSFKINDPKPRDIHKAKVRDRLVHHAVYRILYPYFDRFFIHDSYSCRKDKGTHRALNRFQAYGRTVSKNATRTCWVLKGDVRKFFASIDQTVLLNIVRNRISDERIITLIQNIVESFCSTPGVEQARKGLPLGNLTSQLLVNIYMNEFDQFVKRELKIKHYIRYADDFVVLSTDKASLEKILPSMEVFLSEHLKLELHPDKVFIETLASGIDFLGWVHFPHHRILRTSTRKRMFKNLAGTTTFESSTSSYLGLLSHGNAHKLSLQIREIEQKQEQES